MNDLKDKIVKRLDNIKSLFVDIGAEKLLEDFNGLNFNLNSINFLTSVITRCHPKWWGDIYIDKKPSFLDEFRKEGRDEWLLWSWFLSALSRECASLKQKLIETLQFEDRIVLGEEFKLSTSKKHYVPVVLNEQEDLPLSQTQKETYKNFYLCDKLVLSTQIDKILFDLGHTKDSLLIEKIIVSNTDKNCFDIYLKDENENQIKIAIVDLCPVFVNEKLLAKKEENEMGFSFLYPVTFELKTDKNCLYKLESQNFSFEILKRDNFELEQDFRTLVNNYKKEILGNNKKIVRTSKYETTNQLFVDKSLTKSNDNLWELVYFFDITENTIGSISIKQDKKKPEEMYMVETLINTIKHKQD